MKILVVDSTENIASKLTLHWLGIIAPVAKAYFCPLDNSKSDKTKEFIALEYDWVLNLSGLNLEGLKTHGIESPNVVNYSFKELLEAHKSQEEISLQVNHTVFFLVQKIFYSKDFLCSQSDCKGANPMCCSQCAKTDCNKKEKQQI
jgi:hypothetical protein